MRAWLRTREGTAGGIVGFLLFAVLTSVSNPGGGLIGGLFGVGAVWLCARWWESGTAPGIPVFARPRVGGTVSRQLRRDNNVSLWSDHSGFLFAERAWFVGTCCPPVLLPMEHYAQLVEAHAQGQQPVLVMRYGDRQWWWWQDAFYWDSGEYGAEDVQALLFVREQRHERELEHAKALLRVGRDGGARRREPIPEEVKRLVFQRDGGCCVDCGSNELIQYDHIIPFSIGGSNEPENLQLLCADCNRAKGARL